MHLVALLEILVILELIFVSRILAICVNVLVQIPTLVFIQDGEQQRKLVIYIASGICCC